MKEAESIYQETSPDHNAESSEKCDENSHETPVDNHMEQPGVYTGPQNYMNPGVNPHYYQTVQPVFAHMPQGVNPVYYHYQQPQGFQYVQNPYMASGMNPYPGMAPQYSPHEDHAETKPDESSHADEHGHEKIPKHDEHKYGQFMEIVNDVASGNPPDMSKIMEFMSTTDTQFLKGAVVGAVSTFLLTNETVKNTAVNMMAKMMNAFGKSE